MLRPFILITLLLLLSRPAMASDPKSFQCKQPLPGFTLGETSNPSKSELDQLCSCVWSKFPAGGMGAARFRTIEIW